MIRPGLFILLLSGAALSLSQAASADSFRFRFDTGNVAFAYQDGYWDHNHRWHRWHNHREMIEYQRRYHDHYYDWRHDRDRDHGWHDDHDHWDRDRH